MSTGELQAIVEKLAISQRETDEQMKETDRRMKKTDRQLKELGKQIGGLGRKFGSFTEGLAYASIEKVLREDFELHEFVTPAVKMRKGGRQEEYDVLAYSNSQVNKGMIVEVKSRLRQEDVDQMRRKMDEVFYWLPEHTGKTFYGMVAYVTATTELKKQVIENGWYLVHVGDDVFELETPMGFQPRAYTSG